MHQTNNAQKILIFFLIGVLISSIPYIAYAQSGSVNVLEHDVSYDIENGEVLDVELDIDFVELIVDFIAVDDGLIEINIPRELLDSKLSATDDDIFFIIVDGFETEYIEVESSPTSRTLIIPFFAGDGRLEIIGTNALDSLSTKIEIPSWIKNNAAWWADGQIDDSTFVQGIEFLITEGIMIIPETQSDKSTGESIPSWIKNNAAWWADGQIDDSTFVQGIQYLITKGILTV